MESLSSLSSSTASKVEEEQCDAIDINPKPNFVAEACHDDPDDTKNDALQHDASKGIESTVQAHNKKNDCTLSHVAKENDTTIDEKEEVENAATAVEKKEPNNDRLAGASAAVLTQHTTDLQTLNVTMSQGLQTVLDFKAEKTFLEADIQAIRGRIESKEKELETGKQAVATRRDELHQEQERIRSVEKEIRKTQAKSRHLEQEIAIKTRELLSKKAKHAKEQHEMDLHIQQLEQRLASNASSRSSLAEKLDSLNKQLEASGLA